MGRLLELADQFWQGTTTEGHPWQITGQTEEIADGLFFVHVFANVSVLRTGEGLVMIDTGAWLGRDKTFELVRRIDQALAGTRLALTGNWFVGVSIEDCLTRSRQEMDRLFPATESQETAA